MVIESSDSLDRLLALLQSVALPEEVSERHSANLSTARVQEHCVAEATRASQIENFSHREELDAQARRDGVKPTMVGFDTLLSKLRKLTEETIEVHLLSTEGPAFLVCTNIGTTRLIGMLWSYEEGIDSFP